MAAAVTDRDLKVSEIRLRYGARPGRRGWLCEPRERAFCRTREPAGVLEVLAWAPAVQKAAGLLSRSCRNRREQDPDVVGKLQLATVESRVYFLAIYC